MRAMSSSTGFRSTFVFAFLAAASLDAAACGSGSAKAPDAGSPESGSDAGSTINKAWDWVGVLGTGQSLAVGGYGSEATNAPSFNNLKVGLGALDVSPFDPTMADPASTELTMVALSEPTRSAPGGYPSAYPRNIDGVTPHTAMAAEITTLAMNGGATDYITAHTVVGEAGQAMSVINKAAAAMNIPCQGQSAPGFTCSTGRAYASSLFEITAIAGLAAAAEIGRAHV